MGFIPSLSLLCGSFWLVGLIHCSFKGIYLFSVIPLPDVPLLSSLIRKDWAKCLR